MQVLPARLPVAVPLGMGARRLHHLLWAVNVPTACRQPRSMAPLQLCCRLWLRQAHRAHVRRDNNMQFDAFVAGGGVEHRSGGGQLVRCVPAAPC